MPMPEPKTRDEALLLGRLTFQFANFEEKVIAFSEGGLTSGPGPRGFGLLVVLNEGLMFYVDDDKVLVCPWETVKNVKEKNKLIGRQVTILRTQEASLIFRVSSASIGSEISRTWQASR